MITGNVIYFVSEFETVAIYFVGGTIMINPNESGLIYYGTDISYLAELDNVGMNKPRHRDEQYISVCISGYRGLVKCDHPDLKEMARIFVEELQIATINDNYLIYKPGYENSMTYQQGFGPNPNMYHHTFYGLVNNLRTKSTLTAVLSQEATKYLVIPNEERKFEYLSLSIHSFIEKIDPNLIVGWILPDAKVNEVRQLMENGKLKTREVWSDQLFGSFKYDATTPQRYGCFPSDIKMYIEGISKNEMFKSLRTEHLKRILGNLVDIDWNSDFENELLDWAYRNEDRIRWNAKDFMYESVYSAERYLT